MDDGKGAYRAWRHAHLPAATSLAQQRAAARAATFPFVEPMRAAVQRTHGLLLPDHLFTFLAFWRGLTRPERAALTDDLGLGLAGVLLRLETGAYRQPPPAGRDPRLDWRFYNDPPEFLTVLTGHADGLHFGLWYDDPAAPPAFVADYYNRDGEAIACCGRTLCEVVRYLIEQHEADYGLDADEDYLHMALLRDAVTEYETGERREHGRAYLDAYGIDLSHRLETLQQIGVWVPASRAVGARDTVVIRRVIRGDEATLSAWIAGALEACGRGQAAEALALGHDLHWVSAWDARRESAALQLLETAYDSLGRQPLAAIARVHHHHRHLPSVDLYTR
jgi:hypothetical protein